MILHCVCELGPEQDGLTHGGANPVGVFYADVAALLPITDTDLELIRLATAFAAVTIEVDGWIVPVHEIFSLVQSGKPQEAKLARLF